MRLARSLQGRLVLASLLVLPLFLCLAGYLLQLAYANSLKASHEVQLKGRLYGLLGAADWQDGQLQLPERVADPDLNAITSGVYAAVSRGGQLLWRSSSALLLSSSELLGPLSPFSAVVLLCAALVPVLYFLLRNTTIAGYVLLAVAVIVIGSLIARGIKDGKVQLDKMFGFIILMLFNVVFWACFEQAGSSLTLFADRNVDRMIGGWTMGAATTQFFNPFYILVFGSIFSIMWIKLKKSGNDPSIPMKFGLGILQLGLGYLVILLAAPLAVEYQVPLWTLALLYMLHTTGELFLSPIGLSMVTKLVPKDMTATAMGAWFLSIAGANYAAGMLAKLTGAEHGAGEGEAVDKAASLATYVDVYSNIGYVTVGIGLFLMVLSPLINKLFHGVR